MVIHGVRVEGAIDKQTRCEHYHHENDRIAIKFYCCQAYYPCYMCHAKYGCGNNAVWPKKHFDQQAILCGDCGEKLTVIDYLNSGNICPVCQALFNPGCAHHAHLYFQT